MSKRKELIPKQQISVPGMNTNSNPTVGRSQATQQFNVERTASYLNRMIADRHAHRAIQERDQERRTPNVNVTKGKATGTIQDRNKVQAEKALKWYGLSNGLGQMSNVSDQGRNTASFGNFIGKETARPFETAAFIAPILAAPQTALFGLGTSFAGGYAGGKIGKALGNEQAGEIAGSLIAPIGASLTTAAAKPMLQKVFSNNFADNFGYFGPQVWTNAKGMAKDIGRGVIGKGPKHHPIISSNEDDTFVTVMKQGKPHTVSTSDEGAAYTIGRSQAVSKYAGATDAETPFYLRNNNGSYQYNIEESPYNMKDLLSSPFNPKATNPVRGIDEIARATKEGNIVTKDFLGLNGGNIGLRYDGTFTQNGEQWHRFMAHDLWDLNPVGGAGNAIAQMLEYRPGIGVQPSRLLGTMSRIGQRFPKLAGRVRKVANNPIINREVGRLIGAKPFMMEHPFAVKASTLGSDRVIDWRTGTMNLFSNKKVPGAKYSNPIDWDMPYNLGITERNITYPLFNSWKLSQQSQQLQQQYSE